MVASLVLLRSSPAFLVARRLPPSLEDWMEFEHPVPRLPYLIRLINDPEWSISSDVLPRVKSAFGSDSPKASSRPPSRRRVRVQRAARSRLWVTTIEVSPCVPCNRSSRSKTRRPWFRPDRLWVRRPTAAGDCRPGRAPAPRAAARRRRARRADARARSSKSTSLSQLDATPSASRLLCPRAISGMATFSSAVNSGSR